MKTLKKFTLALLCTTPLLAFANTTFDIAHVREQGNDLIMVVVPKLFDSYPTSDKEQVSAELQKCAKEARVSGKIVLVWPKTNGAMGFFGPTAWSPFLKSIDMRWVKSRVNKELSCS